MTTRGLTVRFPLDLHARLKERAAAEDRSISNLLFRIVKWYLAGEPVDDKGRPVIP